METAIISRNEFLNLSPDERAEYFLKVHKEIIVYCAPSEEFNLSVKGEEHE